MTKQIQRLALAIFLAGLLCAPDRASAQDGLAPASEPVLLSQSTFANRIKPVTRLVLSPSGKYRRKRFSNGPRRVPRLRGASLKRALELGLGTHKGAIALLRGSPPSEPVLKAAGDETPETLLWPVVNGKWGRGFGYTRKARPDLRHNGVDFGAPEGAPIRACAPGIVVYSDNTLTRYGNVVIIVHPNGWTTLYAHNQRNTVQPGWRVKRGERIALVGQTGLAWGPHLHFEFRDNGRLRNPAGLFSGKKSDELNGLLVELDAAGGGSNEAAATVKSGDATEAEEDSSREKAGEQENEGGTADLLKAIGSESAALRLMRSAPDKVMLEELEGRIFSNLLWPVRGGKLTRRFHPVRHLGVDIAAERGTPVRAAADGLVVYSGEDMKGYGKAIMLLHRNGWVTVYGSNQENAVSAGDEVLRGQWIAKVGSVTPRGKTHLYFELLQDGKRQDPAALFVNKPQL